jgi:putative FmdB family regulatory protein
MPLYEYQCEACGKRFEVIQKFSDPVLEICRLCERGPIHRLLSSPAIQFKGSGWYITDYAQKGKSDGAGSGAAAGSDAGTADAAKSDGASASPAKSETKSEGGAATSGSAAKPAD